MNLVRRFYDVLVRFQNCFSPISRAKASKARHDSRPKVPGRPHCILFVCASEYSMDGK